MALCHSERSEESYNNDFKILHFVQDDKSGFFTRSAKGPDIESRRNPMKWGEIPGMNKQVGPRKGNKPQRLGRAGSGFALVAALLAIWILSAVGILVFTVSTQDVRISSRLVGEKMAFSSAETGLHLLTQNFNWQNLNANAASNVRVDPSSGSEYTILAPTIPTSGPGVILYPGFSIGGAEVWGRTRYLASVIGRNTRYNSNAQVDSGIGYGPVDITTIYK